MDVKREELQRLPQTRNATAKIIAVANMKGGVGKTTTVVSLAEAIAAETGESILVIDLDAQANASYCFAGDALLDSMIREGRTIDAFLEDVVINRRETDILPYVYEAVSEVTHLGRPLNISLLAASPQLRLVERVLIHTYTEHQYSMRAIEAQIWNILQAELVLLADRYDVIMFDCAPGISALTEVAIRTADLVIVPTIPDFLSTLGLHAFCNSLWRGRIAQQSALPSLQRPPHVLTTRRQPLRQHYETLEDLRGQAREPEASFRMFDTVIPQTAAIASGLGTIGSRPTFRAKWGANVSSILDDLVQEVRGALK